ncbi:MAG: hypothetical protein QM756_02695 [Polyangiaceae bacterium]
MAPHGVERVDELAPWRGVAHAARTAIVVLLLIALLEAHAAPGRCRAQTQAGWAVAAERQRNTQEPRALDQKRQIEAVQVVILDHVRIELLQQRQ